MRRECQLYMSKIDPVKTRVRSSLKTKSDGKYGLSGQIDSIDNPLNVGAPRYAISVFIK